MNVSAADLELDSPHLPTPLVQFIPWYSENETRSLGNQGLARNKTLALFCSKKCPGSLILRMHDLAHAIRDTGLTAIGGFHSPVEKECLSVLLKGNQPLIICPARSLEGMRVPFDWRDPIKTGRLLLLSPFKKKQRRATDKLAQQRNEFVAALADVVFFAYAAPGSKTESLCRKVLNWQKMVLSFNTPENHHLDAMGVMHVDPSSRLEQLRTLGL